MSWLVGSLSMDVAVPVKIGYGVQYVVNADLVRQQSNGVMMGVGACVIGAIFFVASRWK